VGVSEATTAIVGERVGLTGARVGSGASDGTFDATGACVGLTGDRVGLTGARVGSGASDGAFDDTGA